MHPSSSEGWLFYLDGDLEEENDSKFPAFDVLAEDWADRSLLQYYRTIGDLMAGTGHAWATSIFLFDLGEFYWSRKMRAFWEEQLAEVLTPECPLRDLSARDSLIRTAIGRGVREGMDPHRFCRLLASWIEAIPAELMLARSPEVNKATFSTPYFSPASAKNLWRTLSRVNAYGFFGRFMRELMKNLAFLGFLAVPLVWLGVDYDSVRNTYGLVLLPGLVLVGVVMSMLKRVYFGLHLLLAFIAAEILILNLDHHKIYQSLSASGALDVILGNIAWAALLVVIVAALIVLLADRFLGGRIKEQLGLSPMMIVGSFLMAFSAPLGFLLIPAVTGVWLDAGPAFLVTSGMVLMAAIRRLMLFREPVRLPYAGKRYVSTLLTTEAIGYFSVLVSILWLFRSGADPQVLAAAFPVPVLAPIMIVVSFQTALSFLRPIAAILARPLQVLDSELKCLVEFNVRTMDSAERAVAFGAEIGKFPRLVAFSDPTTPVSDGDLSVEQEPAKDHSAAFEA